MDGYTKLHAKILVSSIWNAPDHVRLLWITLLALADDRGNVEGSVAGIATMARMSVESTADALRILSGPDPDSSDGTTGERIRQVGPGVWFVINHERYRDRQTRRQALGAARARTHYDKQRQDALGSVRCVRSNASNATSRAPVSVSVSGTSDSGTEKKKNSEGTKKKATRPDSVTPETWNAFLANRAAKSKPLTPRAWQMIANRLDAAGVKYQDALDVAVERGWADISPEWMGGASRQRSSNVGPSAAAMVPRVQPEGYHDAGPVEDL